MFYGDTGVEEALSRIESRVARAVTLIDRGNDLKQWDEELRWLVYMLSVRTRALREHTIDTVQKMAGGLRESTTHDRVRSYLSQDAASSFNERTDDALSDLAPKMSAKQRRVAKAAMRDPKQRASIRRQLTGHKVASDGAAHIQGQFDIMGNHKILRKAMKDGQIRGLTKLLDASLAPDSFAPASWTVAELAGEPLFLGDCCVVAKGRSGSHGLLFRFGPEWSTVFLPLGPSTLLVGSRETSGAIPDAGSVNRMSAELSYSYLYAHTADGAATSRAKLIGTADALVSEDEIDGFPDELWDELLGGDDG